MEKSTLKEKELQRIDELTVDLNHLTDILDLISGALDNDGENKEANGISYVSEEIREKVETIFNIVFQREEA